MLRLHSARLLVRDFPTAFRFYRDTLGLKSSFGDENDVYVEFEVEGASISLFKQEYMAQVVGTEAKPAQAEAQDKIALILAVDNVDALYSQLQAKGVEFVTAPQDRAEWGIRTAHFRDTEGNLLEIYTDLPQPQ